MAVGFCIVVSMGAVCCGVGLLTAPWFAAELLGLQLAWSLGVSIDRKGSWWWAIVFLSLVAGVVVATGALTMSSWVQADATDLAMGFSDSSVGLGVVFGLVGITIANLILMPYLFAAPILIDRGGGLGAALADSARLVAEAGVLRFIAFGFLMILVYGSPVVVAMAISLAWGGSALLPWALAVMVPLLAISIPVGQGMIVSAYARRRTQLPRFLRAEPTLTAPRRLSFISMLLLVVASLTLFLLLTILAFSSAPAYAVEAPPSTRVLVEAEAQAELREVGVPRSSWVLRVSRDEVEVRAYDEGGAGRIPLGDRRGVERVAVHEDGGGYWIGMEDAQGWRCVRVTRDGIRVDDGLARRLTAHVSLTEIWMMMLLLLSGVWSLAWGMGAYGEVRQLMWRREAEGVTLPTLESVQAKAMKRSSRVLLFALAMTVAAEAIAFRAMGWL